MIHQDAFDLAPCGLAQLAPDGVFKRVNRALLEWTGFAETELIGGKSLADLLAGEGRLFFADLSAKLEAMKSLDGVFVRLRPKVGEDVPAYLAFALHEGDAGAPTIHVAAVRREARASCEADQIDFLLREVNHRAKNLLAVVHAVARQTARRAATPESFIDAFMARLTAISFSHELLVSREWRGVRVADLARRQFSQFDADMRERIRISGDFVEINPRAAESFGLALHELLANAVKYGALSCPCGAVDLRFALCPETATYSLSWRESGGPAVATPLTAGFGAAVLTRIAPMSIQGDGVLDFAPEGLVYRLSAPLAEVAMV